MGLIRRTCAVIVGSALLWTPVALAGTQVTAVRAQGGAVEIVASAAPNFTTFTMTNPPRLVVDLAEAAFSGVPPETAVGAGDIVSIKTLNYGSGSNAVARVMITYTKEIETDIVTSGNNIEVRPSAASPAVSAATLAQALAPAAPAPAAAPPPPPEPAPEPAVPSPPPPAAAAAEPSPATPPYAAQSAPPPPRAPAPAAPAPSPAAASPEPAAALKGYAQADNAPPPPPEDSASGPPPTAPAPVAPSSPPEPPARSTAESASDLAASPPPPSSTGAVQVSGRRKTLSLVGLRFTDGPAVFVRTSEPVNYQVNERGDAVVLTIENTRIARGNDSRTLDAHFFDSPINSVKARQVRRNVEVNIQLKNHASYQATQNGSEVQLSFNRS